MGMERNTEKGKEVSMFKLKFLGISDSYDPNYDYDYDYYPWYWQLGSNFDADGTVSRWDGTVPSVLEHHNAKT